MNAHCLPAFVITTVLQACSDQKSLKNFVGEGLGRRKVEGRGGAVLGLLVAACSHVSKCILELGFRYLISSRPFVFFFLHFGFYELHCADFASPLYCSTTA